MKKPSREKVLEIAAHHEFRVHKYAWSAADMRKLTRRMLKDGDLILVRREYTHYIYRKAP